MLIKQILYKDTYSSQDAILVLSRLPPLPEDLSGPPPLRFLSSVKALVNEDTLLRTDCCPWCFLGCAKWKTFVADTKCFWTKSETFFVSATNVARAGKRGNICVSNKVSATMYPRLPGPLCVKPLLAYLVSRVSFDLPWKIEGHSARRVLLASNSWS